MDNSNSSPLSGGDGVGTKVLSGILYLKNEQMQDMVIKALMKEGIKKPFKWIENIVYYEFEDKQEFLLPHNPWLRLFYIVYTVLRLVVILE